MKNEKQCTILHTGMIPVALNTNGYNVCWINPNFTKHNWTNLSNTPYVFCFFSWRVILPHSQTYTRMLSFEGNIARGSYSPFRGDVENISESESSTSSFMTS